METVISYSADCPVESLAVSLAVPSARASALPPLSTLTIRLFELFHSVTRSSQPFGDGIICELPCGIVIYSVVSKASSTVAGAPVTSADAAIVLSAGLFTAAEQTAIAAVTIIPSRHTANANGFFITYLWCIILLDK